MLYQILQRSERSVCRSLPEVPTSAELRGQLHAVCVLVGKGPARLLLCLVGSLIRFADLHQPAQTKRAPGR